MFHRESHQEHIYSKFHDIPTSLTTPVHLIMKKIKGIRACVFDAYGTLFDIASATARCSGISKEQRAALTPLWRDKQLQYTWLRSLQGHYVDFWRITVDALDFSLESLGITNHDVRDQLLSLYQNLQAFPEVADTLRQLRSAGFKTAILSNGTPSMLHAAIHSSSLEGLFDHVLSAESVQMFKTHPKVYQYALDALNLTADQISFQSSNAWDAFAASAFGMRVVWCNRYHQQPEHLPGCPDCIISNLGELPALLDIEP